jgi:hypothetical protein
LQLRIAQLRTMCVYSFLKFSFSYEDAVTFPVHVPLILDDAYGVASGEDELHGDIMLPLKSPPPLPSPPPPSPPPPLPGLSVDSDEDCPAVEPLAEEPLAEEPLAEEPLAEEPLSGALLHLQMHGGQGVFL